MDLVDRTHCRSSFREVVGTRSWEAGLFASKGVVHWPVKVHGSLVAASRWTWVVDVPLVLVARSQVVREEDPASKTYVEQVAEARLEKKLLAELVLSD